MMMEKGRKWPVEYFSITCMMDSVRAPLRDSVMKKRVEKYAEL